MTIYDGMIRNVVETPEHLEIQKLTEQIRERVDKLEWMLGRVVSEDQRANLEAEWAINRQNAKAAPSNTSDKDSFPQMI